MRILVENTLLSDSNLAVGQVGPSGLVLNGQAITDPFQFWGALVSTIYVRSEEPVQVQFSVSRSFDSLRLAQKFLFTHRDAVPRQGLVQFIAGEGADVETLYMEDAVVEPQIVSYSGVTVVVGYVIKGAAVTSDVPADLPGTSDSAEETVVMRRGNVAIASGATSVVVTFSAPLSAVPVVPPPSVSRPAGGDTIFAIVREDTITINGFTCDLTGATPDATYHLHYIAFE